MAEKYRATRDDMKARIKEGHWEEVGGMWVEPDLNLLFGESIVRQLLVGTRYLKREYGSTVHGGWNPDTFGYTWQLPQIYKNSEIDYFVTRKMAWNETNPLPLKLFYWQSADGSRVLTYFPHDYNNPVLPDKLAEDFNMARSDIAGGSGVAVLYKDAQRDYDVVHLVAQTTQARALHDLNGYVNTAPKGTSAKDAVPVIVWNSLAWPRMDTVTAEVPTAGTGNVGRSGGRSGQGGRVTGIEGTGECTDAGDISRGGCAGCGIPGFLCAGASAAQAAGVQVASGQGATVLENESLRVTIDMGNGCITHLVDKKTGFDSIAKGGCGNQLQAFHDNPEDYDAWNIDPGTLDHPIALDKADAVTVVEQRPRPSSRGIS